jgi:hypothetical protein
MRYMYILHVVPYKTVKMTDFAVLACSCCRPSLLQVSRVKSALMQCAAWSMRGVTLHPGTDNHMRIDNLLQYR